MRPNLKEELTQGTANTRKAKRANESEKVRLKAHAVQVIEACAVEVEAIELACERGTGRAMHKIKV